ncbi:MAG TPA: glycoside hydrolase family 43 protein [Mobilitalea sp.]|nr:glycoside hydrolase family 43 protein [Mobilitalea sp.]
MRRNFHIRLLLAFLFLISLAGCQAQQTTVMSNQSITNEPIVSDDKKANEKEDNTAMNKGEDMNTNGNQPKAEYKPTIANPEKLFENIELVDPYKKIGYHNPLVSQRFGADPFAMVYNDRVYVYMTNDAVEYDGAGKVKDNTYGKIKSLNVVSSDDLVNWTDHSSIQVGGYQGASKWANNSWAPAAIHKKINGKEQFFIYYADSARGIGVLQGDSPVGPFADPIGKPLVSKQTENCSDIVWLFDPAVFTDDNGKSYLYFGGGVPEGQDEMPNTGRVVELGEDMISIVGTPKVIEAPYFFEDSGVNKIGNTYYYSYCSNWASRDNAVGPYKPDTAAIIYMTSDNPIGPWQYQKSILLNPGKFFGTYGNNHHSMVNFKGKWYMFYHSQLLQDNMGMKGGYRSTHVDEVQINDDGSIQSVIATKFGVKQLSNFDPYKVNEAETMAWMGGITTKRIDESSSNYGAINLAVTDITTGDWIGLSNVDFGDTTPTTFTAKVSSEYAGNVIKIAADKQDGESIGYLEVPKTDSSDKYVEVTVNVSQITGAHNLFFIFNGQGFNFDSWSFKK